MLLALICVDCTVVGRMVDVILEDVGFTVDTWVVVDDDNDEAVALELADAVVDDVSLT